MNNSPLSNKNNRESVSISDELHPYNVDNIDGQIQNLLTTMSKVGFLIDVEVINNLEVEVEDLLKKLSVRIFHHIGYDINLNSSKQIAKLLYEDLELPSGKKKKTGFSTDEVTLKKIKKLHPIIPLILEYRTVYKLKSTYLESLRCRIEEDGRIHSTFLLDVASTGRIVSRDPNLQNIPIRGSWGEKIRKAFIVPCEKILIAIDYSQIDLRVLTHFSKESKLIEAFKQNQDIHLSTAMEIFNKKASDITADERRIAKTVNFGIIYGISPHGLSESLEINQKQAAYFIKTYLDKYPQVKQYLDLSRQNALKNGYTETLGGEKRYIPELKSKNHFIRSSGERMAINYPIQGSSAEIIKLAMLDIDCEFVRRKLSSSKMILQIHDELVFEVGKEEKDAVIKIVKEKMENVVKLIIPLRVSIKEGINWGEMTEIQDE